MEGQCNFKPYFRMKESLALFSLYLFWIKLVTIIITLLLWTYNYKHPYLQYRTFPLVLLFSFAILINVFEQSLNRATFIDYVESNFTQWKTLHKCEFEVFNSNNFVPLAILAQSLRLFKWYKNMAYNQKLAELFSLKEINNQYFTTEASSSEDSKQQLLDLKSAANDSKILIYSLSGTLLIFVFCALFSFLFCPLSDNCLYDTDSVEAQLGLILNLPPAIAYLYLVYSVNKARKNYPDPFNLLKEILFTMSIPIASALVYAVCRFSDPFDVLKEEREYSFSYGIITDIGIFLAFVCGVSYPVFVSYQRRKQGSEAVSLQEVLGNDTGRQLFRAHLVFEFAVESLDFYLTVSRFKEVFGKDGRGMEKAARNVFNRFIRTDAVFQVNASYRRVKEVERLIEEEEVSLGMFDGVLDEVYSLMEMDSFSRFVNSSLYKEYIGQVATRNKSMIPTQSL